MEAEKKQRTRSHSSRDRHYLAQNTDSRPARPRDRRLPNVLTSKLHGEVSGLAVANTDPQRFSRAVVGNRVQR